MPVHRSSEGLDLLLGVRRGDGPLHAQVESALRAAIGDGRLAAGTPLPATRALAAELGVSRSVVTEAYTQLAAEGFLELRPRALPRVMAAAAAHREATSGRPAAPSDFSPQHDLRPGAPALDLFPRREWLRSIKTALDELPDSALDYPAPEGVPRLRATLGAYLGRVRGVRSEAPLICAGVSQSLRVAADALRATGRTTLAVEDPGHADVREMLTASGLTLVGVPVDADGLVVEALPPGAGAVLVTPAHQYPTGVVLAPNRRTALIAWARANDAYVLEDDYDAEFRYDRTPVGTLQGLAPDRVAATSSVSKTLAPALRLGWLTLPPGLERELVASRHAAGHGLGAIEQHALAGAIERGTYDRHIRKARRVYRERRDILIAALARELPAAPVGGIAAGLHLTLGVGDEQAAVIAAARARVAVDGLSRHRVTTPGPQALVVGYGRTHAAALPRAVTALAAAISPP